MYWDGEMHALMSRVFPEFVVGGRMNLRALANEVGYCYYTMLKAFTADTLTLGVAKAIINYAEKVNRPLEKEEILDFLLR